MKKIYAAVLSALLIMVGCGEDATKPTRDSEDVDAAVQELCSVSDETDCTHEVHVDEEGCLSFFYQGESNASCKTTLEQCICKQGCPNISFRTAPRATPCPDDGRLCFEGSIVVIPLLDCPPPE